MAQVVAQGSNPGEEVEALRAEVERLKDRLARRPPDFTFLGETIAGDVLSELTKGGKLTARGVQTRGEGMHGDGGNLWLQVTPGGRSWLFRFRWGAKQQREMGLGAVTEVSLTDARARAAICRRLIRDGVDPIERRSALAAAEAPAKRTTFKDAAQRYYDSKKAGWRSDKHAIQFPNTMRDYVYPIIGELAVQDVDTDRVLRILEQEVSDGDGKGRLWTAKPETASRVRARIEQVLDWASARKMAPGRQRGAVERPLGRAATGAQEGPRRGPPRRPALRGDARLLDSASGPDERQRRGVALRDPDGRQDR